MKFSEYTITAKPEQSIDPLGFTQPFGALRNRLYPQFTVLSNSPAYHGMLALAYQLLSERKTIPGQDGFGRRFREVECLWGLANVAASQSILNVTKYQTILEGRDSIALIDIGRGNAIFRSLAYGTLGHYSNPCVAWGFLDRGAIHLTQLGNSLADEFATRRRHSLRKTTVDWLSGKEVSLAELKALGDVYGLESPPMPDEQLVWGEAVKAWCSRAPETAALWTTPPSNVELDLLRKDAKSYQNFFPSLAAHYPGLAKTFEQIRRFETMSAICLFLFEREYLLCHDAGPTLPHAGTLEKNLAENLTELAKAYLANDNHQDTKGLFAALTGANDHFAAASIIVHHHIRHQKSKGALPYMENGELRVRDRFDRQGFTALHEELSALGEADEQLAMLSFRYQRDWHFDRALRYVRYFRGNA